MQTSTLREVNQFLSQMQQEKAQGKGIVMFHICSVGQIQFMLPIYKELRSRQASVAFYLACDYPMSEKFDLMGIPPTHRVTTEVAKQLDLTDVVLQAEIHGRGPQKAARVFVGHGQPNKHTNWSEENLRSFDHYFLYGELERSMFEVIMRSRPESTRHIKLYNVGYPKLDDQIQGKYDREAVLRDLRLDPNLKTVIYAPAWDPGGSLRTLGTTVVEELLTLPGLNVIAKLHPASLEPEGSPYHTFYTGGVNWAREFQALESNPRFRYVNDYLVNPLLIASDLMVTDFSGVALEFMVQDRPVIHIDSPEFYEKTLREWGNDPDVSKNDERFNAGRNTGLLIKNLSELSGAVQRSLSFPGEFSEKRRALVAKFLYNPGRASCVAADTVLTLVQQQQRDPIQPLTAATTSVKSPPVLLEEAVRLMEAGRHASALSKLNAAAKQSTQLAELHLRRAQCLAALNHSREAVEAAVSELLVNSGSSAAVQILVKYQNELLESLKTAAPAVIETINRVLREYAGRVTSK